MVSCAYAEVHSGRKNDEMHDQKNDAGNISSEQFQRAIAHIFSNKVKK